MIDNHNLKATYLIWYFTSEGLWQLRFYVKESRIRAYIDQKEGLNTLENELDCNKQSTSIGNGVFTARHYPKGTHLNYYDGNIIPNDLVEALKQTAEGRSLLTQ